MYKFYRCIRYVFNKCCIKQHRLTTQVDSLARRVDCCWCWALNRKTICSLLHRPPGSGYLYHNYFLYDTTWNHYFMYLWMNTFETLEKRVAVAFWVYISDVFFTYGINKPNIKRQHAKGHRPGKTVKCTFATLQLALNCFLFVAYFSSACYVMRYFRIISCIVEVFLFSCAATKIYLGWKTDGYAASVVWENSYRISRNENEMKGVFPEQLLDLWALWS